ncbi:putative bifunctional diguanylate cyclase/phosphodiesterase [Sphingomonas desiccabilis]|uniref:GGDEF domain-containing response regulator n=1 Tax=Sphingomonas desiccabilis TaxID=429134 RepID=A0A4Q2IV80_9SPHN|nr:EAL domain-containing protein [Sphingomonas desiccabilis]MBB3911088.1 diguanylate cyclase (GGDEF)-like protein [Sphingomonas desiccabilis]RXZ32099.1 GGDEF domain-containing response regulator [Sphingomonas desiccabilis]
MHESYRHAFRRPEGERSLSAMAAELFEEDGNGALAADPDPELELVHVSQGLEAVAAVEEAVRAGRPFAVAFIDVRMPPGIDGKETAARIRAIDPDVSLVIVTGFSDFAPAEIFRAAGPADKIFYIAKPFEAVEVVQTATALAHRWQLDRELAATRAALAEKVARLEEQALELAANESKAAHLASHDSLTEAPNRLAFLRALSERVHVPGCFAVAMLDIDRFKLINDTFGHFAGDEVIRTVCNVLSEQIGDDGLVARLAGDEFGLMMSVSGEDDAVMRCERLLRACSGTLSIFGQSVQNTASIGLVVADADHQRDSVDIMRRADLALNEAKRAGRNLVRVFDESMDDSVRFRRQIESGLGQAMANGELSLVYQPIFARGGLEVVAFEALLRWCSPEHGMISPGMFIPVAEESGLIHDLGDWVVGEALEAAKRWPGQFVSVNFSPRQFRRQNFVAQLVGQVQRAGVSPNQLQIEITETALAENAERAADTLYRLRQMGFRVAIDDFGTGYSSLYNIRTFALDTLKIDSSFVDGMGRERESAAIVHSIIHLGRALGLEVVAEGVENETQLQALRLAGCSQVQGYYLSPPLVAEDAVRLAEGGSVLDPQAPCAPEAQVPGTGTTG